MSINILRQHVQAVFRFAVRITRRKEVAEDLTSEAFLALHRERASSDPSQLPAWLLTVVRNRARNLWRHQVIEERYAVEMKPAAPLKAVPASSLEEWILASPGLKPVHRLCVMPRYVSGMTRAEIAAETGLSQFHDENPRTLGTLAKLVDCHVLFSLALSRRSSRLPDSIAQRRRATPNSGLSQKGPARVSSRSSGTVPEIAPATYQNEASRAKQQPTRWVEEVI